VLFLDELPEFRRDALEALRQPLEEGQVTISRVFGRLTMPSRFILCAAMNPCKCGWYGQPGDRCRCSPQSVKQYLGRISGPLLDRIDLHVDVPAVGYDELTNRDKSETSAEIRKRVNAARERQYVRTGAAGIVNADLTHAQISEFCVLGSDENNLMKNAFERLRMTARSHDKILKVARTIADLEEAERINVSHIAEALQYRGLDRMFSEE
jgi:magnesium chelatase family protein